MGRLSRPKRIGNANKVSGAMTNIKNSVSRKSFLQILAAAGAAGVTAKFGWDAFSAPIVVDETRVLMGTVVKLKVVGKDRQSANEAVGVCFSRMEHLESMLSRFRAESQLSQLNRQGKLFNPAPSFVDVVRSALTISEQTGGKFDFTVKPLLDLYQRYQDRNQNLPPEKEIRDTLRLVNYQKIHLDERGISLEDPAMSVTLDGIAKGYIVDQGVGVLKERGYGNILVEAGGDLAACGKNERNDPWKIGVLSPRHQDKLLTRVAVSDKALATSGDYLRSFSEDFKHHHIVDPQRGHSSPELASVTILATSGMLADGYATAVMVLGLDRGKQLIESLPRVEALMVTKSLQRVTTPGFPSALRSGSS